MGIDKDRPSTWTAYYPGKCSECIASCCMMPVEVRLEDILRLELISPDEWQSSPKKAIKLLKQKGLISNYRHSTELFMLQSAPNGDCLFLETKSRLCTVYDKRPDTCRNFPKVGPRPGYCPKLSKP